MAVTDIPDSLGPYMGSFSAVVASPEPPGADTVMRNETVLDIHAESDSQLQAALEYGNSVRRLI